MDISRCISSMTRSSETIAALMSSLEPHLALRRPGPQKWCLAEIMAHLHDEEVEDFRVRLDFTLHRPGEPWPGIDPEGWVSQRNYAARPLADSLQGYLEERRKSVRWLGGLGDVDWEVSYEHPHIGVLRAGDIMTAWASHDLLHIRQVVHTLFDLLGEDAVPYATRYAGEWPDKS